MAQLRHDDEKLKSLNTETLVMMPNNPFMIKRYLSSNPSRFTILTDMGSKIASQYFQVKQFLAIGTPTIFVIDKQGKIPYAYYAKSALEEPGDDAPLAVLEELAGKHPIPIGKDKA